jgi:hypothetical protein
MIASSICVDGEVEPRCPWWSGVDDRLCLNFVEGETAVLAAPDDSPGGFEQTLLPAG